MLVDRHKILRAKAVHRILDNVEVGSPNPFGNWSLASLVSQPAAAERPSGDG
jgi:hypothetical protein